MGERCIYHRHSGKDTVMPMSKNRVRFAILLLLLVSWPQLSNASDSADQVRLMRDDATGLTWATCVIGHTGKDCAGNAEQLAWVDALNRARGSELGGITDWRMPRIEELKAMHRRTHARLVNLFPRLNQSIVWSASANLDYATDAWAFDFVQGKPAVHGRDEKLRVLLVSGP